jgi:hypothetical protein
MWVELRLPPEIMTAVAVDTEAERGPSEFSVVLDVVGAVSNVFTVAQLLKAAPELARRLRARVQKSPSRLGEERLVIKGPGVSVELDLPPNVSSQKIVDALTAALQPEATEREAGARAPKVSGP